MPRDAWPHHKAARRDRAPFVRRVLEGTGGAREQPDAKFAVQGDQRLTYTEAAATVNHLARVIVQSEIEVGEHAELLTPHGFGSTRSSCGLAAFTACHRFWNFHRRLGRRARQSNGRSPKATVGNLGTLGAASGCRVHPN